MNLFERIYRSCRQLPYDDMAADSLWEHIQLCIKDPDCLREMANSWKKDFELPVNIWIDFGKSYLKSGHSKRIKFQKDRLNRINQSNLASMDLNGSPVAKTMSGCKLTSKEIKMVSNFVINNKKALEYAADGMISFTEFSKIVIIGGEIADSREIEEQEKSLFEMILGRG